jgi:polysulfide reductase chain C
VDPIILWQHKWSADLFIPSYLFLGGLTAGLFLVAAASDLLSPVVRRLLPLARVAGLAALPVVGLAGFFLTVHLGKPERGLGFPLFFTNYNSWMTRGGWVVGAGAPLVALYAALWYFRVWPGLRRLVALVGIPVLAFLGMYTGYLLSGAGFVPLWSERFLPTLFLTSGVTGGVAAASLLLVLAWPWLAEAGAHPRPLLRGLAVALGLLIVLEGYELREFLGYLARQAPDKALVVTTPSGDFVAPTGSRLAWEYVTGGPGYPRRLLEGNPAAVGEPPAVPRPTLAPWFWWGVVGLGLLLPMALTLVELLAEALGPRPASAVTLVKCLAILAGGFVLRLVMVWGGDLKAPLPYPPSTWPVPGLGG